MVSPGTSISVTSGGSTHPTSAALPRRALTRSLKPMQRQSQRRSSRASPLARGGLRRDGYGATRNPTRGGAIFLIRAEVWQGARSIDGSMAGRQGEPRPASPSCPILGCGKPASRIGAQIGGQADFCESEGATDPMPSIVAESIGAIASSMRASTRWRAVSLASAMGTSLAIRVAVPGPRTPR
jgi:hypothetical protein